MHYLFSCHTDAGLRKKMNQDAYIVKVAKYDGVLYLMAAVCDGVGGLSHGEYASGEVIEQFSEWFDYELPQFMHGEEDFDTAILGRWSQLVQRLDKKLAFYAGKHQMQMGTTATIVLFAETNYYLCHVGDCRLYKIKEETFLLTEDHSLVAREVAEGKLTPEEAERDKRKNIILQCIGAGSDLTPDFMIGDMEKDTVYLLCSDGFRHKLSKDELYHYCRPEEMKDPKIIKAQQQYLTELVKARGELDNITSIIIRTME